MPPLWKFQYHGFFFKFFGLTERAHSYLRKFPSLLLREYTADMFMELHIVTWQDSIFRRDI